MPTHDHNHPEDRKREEIDASAGYERSDVRVSGIVVFLIALGIFVVVTALLCYGIGKVINAQLAKEHGPRSKWAAAVDVRPLGNMPSSPELQNKLADHDAAVPHAAVADR